MPIDVPLKATVQHLNTVFCEALARGDLAALAALYSDDAVLFPHEVGTIVGREGIVSYWRQFPTRRLSFETTRAVGLNSETVREFGRLHMGGAGAEAQPKLRYLTIWRLAGEDWRITSCMWNRLAPAHIAVPEPAVALDPKGRPIAYVPRVT